MRLTAGRFDDIAPVSEKGNLNFLSVLVARIKLDQPEMGEVRDRAIDDRAVIATATIEVTVDLR